jgi:phosphate-selective porin OprO/OprP
MLYVMEFDLANTSIFNQQNAIANSRDGVPTGPLTGTTNTPAASIPAPMDLWIGFRRIPIIGNLRIGNQKEPFGFERLESSRFLNFMERSFNNDAFYSTFTNGFVPGVQIFNTAFDLRMTWAAGIFKTMTNPFDFTVGGGDFAESMRLTGLLLYKDEGREVMHLGTTLRTSGYDNGTNRFRVRGPERAGLPSVWANYADTANFRGSGGFQDINVESVNVFGPWTIDAEYDFHFSNNAFINPHQPSVGTLFYSGGYVEILYFLTGEHRTYIRESGLYDRIVPRKNAYWVKGKDGKPNEFGWGAWQVGIRYNYLNLNDKGINGGVLQDITLGLNWFINPNCKFQWNYSVTERHSPASPTTGPGQSDGTIQGFGMRYAMDY